MNVELSVLKNWDKTATTSNSGWLADTNPFDFFSALLRQNLLWKMCPCRRRLRIFLCALAFFALLVCFKRHLVVCWYYFDNNIVLMIIHPQYILYVWKQQNSSSSSSKKKHGETTSSDTRRKRWLSAQVCIKPLPTACSFIKNLYGPFKSRGVPKYYIILPTVFGARSATMMIIMTIQ